MTRIVDIKDVLPTLNTSEYEHSFDVVIDNDTILTTSDMLLELDYNYHDMSYVSHKEQVDDVDTLLTLWNLYKKRYSEEWGKIYKDVAYTTAQNYNPMNEYSETKTITPDITNTTSREYGSDNDTTTTVTHGLVNTMQTNTYEGALRDSGKSTNSGTDTTSSEQDISGSDEVTSTTTGTTTETKSGYRTNPLDNLQKDIDFAFRNNLRDLIINNFARDILFYNNDNRGCSYGICY